MQAVLSACVASETGERQDSAASTVPSRTPVATTSPFPYSAEPIEIVPGAYEIPKSEWSLFDFTITFPADWTVQYGHVYHKQPDTADEIGLYAVVVDAIYSDACQGSTGELLEVGPSVDDLAVALLEQPGPAATAPVRTTLGGYPATRIDLTLPQAFDLTPCNLGDVGLQVWYSPPADKYFVLGPGSRMSVYIVDVDGQRHVFLAGGVATSDADWRELQTVLDSIRIEP
jgi:hypothetical protein